MSRLAGTFLIVVSAASFGTLPILAKYAYEDGMNVPTVLFLRFALAAAVMGVVLSLVTREPLPRGAILMQLVAMGALGYVGQSFAFLTALEYASAGLVALLLYLYPTFVAILSFTFLHEKLTRVSLVALVVAFIGTVLTVSPEGGEATGILLGVSAALIYSVYIIVGTNVMKHVSEVQSSTVIFAAAGAVFGVMMLAGDSELPDSGNGWAAVLGIVAFGTIIPVLAFLAGLERIGPTNASTISKLEPVVTILLAAWLFHERLPPVALVGGAMILGSVAMLARSQSHAVDEPLRGEG